MARRKRKLTADPADRNARDHYREMTQTQKDALLAQMQARWEGPGVNNAIKKNCWAPPLWTLIKED